LPAIASTGNRLAGLRIHQSDLAAPNLAGSAFAEQQAGDE
jgi:hypothetical protein